MSNVGRWFRFYDDSINDPKVQRLSAEMFRAWVNMLCLASKYGGAIPKADIAFAIRASEKGARAIVDNLIEHNLLDDCGDVVTPHNWDGRQYKSDVTDPTAASRQKKYRNAKRNGDRNGDRNATVTVTATRTETETERKIGANAPDAGYAFEGKIVKLRRKSFDDWVKAYPNLDLIGELTARDAWLASAGASDADRARWFVSTSQHLANRNMTAKAKVVAMKPDGKPMTRAEELRREGII